MADRFRSSGADSAYRLLLADDSGTVRRLMRRLLDREPDVRVVAEAENGRSAVDMVRQAAASGQPIEIVLLDVEMPVMDGITALERLAKVRPAPQVIMLSAHTRQGAVVTVKALARGAYDYVCKPVARSDRSFDSFRRELLGKIRAGGKALRMRRQAGPRPTDSPASTKPTVGRATSPARPADSPAPATRTDSSVTRPPRTTSPRAAAASPAPTTRLRSLPPHPRPTTATRPTALAIGSSTGGPQAVLRLLRDLGPRHGIPIFLTQHMPPAFTAAFAEQIAQELDLPCSEARQGETVEAGRIYVAPGDFHLLVEGRPDDARIQLSKSPPENFCRPAVDPMLRSLVSVYGERLVAVILTGMGSDGAEGCREVAEAGGRILVQDRETSVVWGMPGAVVAAGLPATVLPLQQIGGHLRTLMNGLGR